MFFADNDLQELALDKVKLTEEQIELQSLEELKNNLETVSNGLYGVLFISVRSNHKEYWVELYKPRLLEIKKLILRRIRLFDGQQRPVQKIDNRKDRLTTPHQIKILFLTADPTDESRLRLGEEFREIQEKLQQAEFRDRFKLHQRMSVRPVDISQALLYVKPQIVHFSGHGTATGALCFENQTGKAHPIQPDVLAELFEQFANQVDCVLLNACYSETQAKAIAKYIKYVIGMNQAIGDEAAITFSIGFYQALGAGRTIEEAYKLGRAQIGLQGIPEHSTPVLIKREQVQL